MSVNLGEMSLKELKDLQSQIAKAIGGFEDRKKKQAIAELEEKARQMGYSWAEITGSMPVRKRSPAVAKYSNPSNVSETWSGRGRKPRWFVAALASGKKPEQMAI